MGTRIIRLLIISVCGGLLSACGVAQATPSPSPDPYVTVLKQYGWSPQGEPTIQRITLTQIAALPFRVTLDASKASGMDFSHLEGQSVTLRTYFLGREPKENLEVFANLLTDNEHVVGAWIAVKGQYPGVHPLTTALPNLVGGQP